MSESTRDRLLAYLARRSPATGPELGRHLGITRQALSQQLRPLIASGDVVKSGSTRGARYYAADQAPRARSASSTLDLRRADEGRVYDDLAVRLGLENTLRGNVAEIVHYAFTEMLNNAIEHSGADTARLALTLGAGVVSFEIRDRGIGVFKSIVEKHALDDEHAAMVELIKGRTTTMPEAHSGEGIFFTSRAADRFTLRSHRIRLQWDSATGDVYASDERFLEGTLVEFAVRRDARRELTGIFSKFAPEEYDYRFDKTEILVRLLRDRYVSRSEARRLTANLERFRNVTLDFDGVRSVGQGFADEVFRVFPSRHPNTEIRAVNAPPAVDAMLKHARATSRGEQT